MKDYKAIVSKLTLDEKIMLLNGVKMNTVPLPEYDIGTVQMYHPLLQMGKLRHREV